MYIDDSTYTRNGKTYRRVLLRHSYRENGITKKKLLGNISDCPDEEIEAMKIALIHKSDIAQLKQLAAGKATNGKIVGPVRVIYDVAKQTGIQNILGKSNEALFVMWLIMARLIDQGSRLSAVRLARIHAGCELLGIDTINEDYLYNALDWLYTQHESIEKKIFQQWQTTHQSDKENTLFLYDVTSSYFEGECNELAMYGYNRDKKKGKKQLVWGLLTDSEGEPLAIEVFQGNTADTNTVGAQIEKIKNRFGCKHITMVGDKGMLKSLQIGALHDETWNYITSITKAQIEILIRKGTFQLELFTKDLVDIEDVENEIRYVLHKNPIRAKEISENRKSKIASIEKKVQEGNQYLKEHPRAKVTTRIINLKKYINKVKLGEVIEIKIDSENTRILFCKVNEDKLKEKSKFDGCYVIKTDLPKTVADKETIHQRYKALAEVERGFRTSKTILKARPIHLRKKERTTAHMIINMLGYKIQRVLENKWSGLNMTVDEGLETLKEITEIKIKIGESEIIKTLKPNVECERLLNLSGVVIPTVLPNKKIRVVTYKNLVSRRKHMPCKGLE